jgi:hypothetical protein
MTLYSAHLFSSFIDSALLLNKRMDGAIEAKNFKLCDQLEQEAVLKKDFPMTFEDFERFKVPWLYYYNPENFKM